MQRLHALLFDVWREACQHIEIATSVSRIARLLEERVQIRGVLVRRIDHERRTLETVASSPPSSVEGAEEARLELTAAAFEDLLDWCGHRALFRSSSGQEAPNGVLPPGIDDEVLAGPLTVEGRAAGVLVLIADRGRHFDREDESVILALLDPFSTALENDRRLREMATLRQAAEADKLSALTRLGRTSLTADIVGAELGLRPVLQRVDLVA
ncbi:MAG: formate hydrogenlyase transcriptional activator, partial [Candidatus Binatota bacterium]|nr:formate hydrogenlyase transcriptional activator [Candidatus Binatota bacterium]